MCGIRYVVVRSMWYYVSIIFKLGLNMNWFMNHSNSKNLWHIHQTSSELPWQSSKLLWKASNASWKPPKLLCGLHTLAPIGPAARPLAPLRWEGATPTLITEGSGNFCSSVWNSSALATQANQTRPLTASCTLSDFASNMSLSGEWPERLPEKR